MCQSKAQGGKRCAAGIARDTAAAEAATTTQMPPGAYTPRPYKPGEAHRPPAVAPAPPDRSVGQRLLDLVVAYWRIHHGEVKDISGIPECELIKDKTVKENIEAELRVEAVEVFGKGTRVISVHDENANTMVITLVGPDGVEHKGEGVAIRDRWGCMTYKTTVWDPPTVNATTTSTPDWMAGARSRAIPTMQTRTHRPAAPAAAWAEGMRHR